MDDPTEWTRRRVLAVAAGTAGAGAVGALAAAGARDALQPAPLTVLPTAFGSLTVLSATRGPRTDLAGDSGRDDLGAHLWPDVVRADVELTSTGRAAALVAAGQLRLRVGEDGPTVAPLATGWAARPLRAGEVARTWVSWRAPGGPRALSLVLEEAGREPVSVPVVPRGATSPTTHDGHLP